MTDKEVQEAVARADAEYDMLKDRVHEQYDEIEKLKEDVEYYKSSRDELITSNTKLREEKLRLNNIIKELEKFMDEEYEYYEKYGYAEQGHAMGEIRRIKNKLQELKGVNKSRKGEVVSLEELESYEPKNSIEEEYYDEMWS